MKEIIQYAQENDPKDGNCDLVVGTEKISGG